ncbi:hypothetical protein V9T40_010350 [Parthenolecanium corni]|uniref:Inositol polyphosphate-related phosphatase domain-containing protein n=1 Tax=Parthenolecanium corni TaxID=536013 RepID=A0AAN9TCH9_9HEMI
MKTSSLPIPLVLVSAEWILILYLQMQSFVVVDDNLSLRCRMSTSGLVLVVLGSTFMIVRVRRVFSNAIPDCVYDFINYLMIYIITWNVATGFPEENLLDLLDLKRFQNKNSLPDFYIIGLQEVKSQPHNLVVDSLFNDPWTNAFKTALAPYDYVKVKTTRLVGLLLNIFCLRKHVIHLRDIGTEQTRTGLMGLWGNKGAVTIRLQIYGCSMCLVNCHLAAHDHAIRERIDDYNAILQGQKLPFKDTSTILFHDYVFWFGDLNFRLSDESTLTSKEIIKKIDSKQFEWLLEKDQLRQVMGSGEAFSELTENELKFKPTYKFFVGSSDYDPKRRPAWTDRILFRVNKFAYENIKLDVNQLSYDSIEQYTLSDHKPVISELLMKVFSNYSDRLVEIRIMGTWKCDQENKAMIVLESDVTPTLWDWIGLFQDNFNSLDDYAHYVYLTMDSDVTSPPSSSDNETSSGTSVSSSPTFTANRSSGNKYVVTFPDTAVRSPGQYRLLYFTRDSSSVLGMSDRFEVKDNNGIRVPLDW